MQQDHPNRPGPVVQSVSLGMRALFGVAAFMALLWLGSNIRRVPPDSTAVVFRFGAIVRTQGPGLLVALPAPFETVTTLPGAAQQITHLVAAQPRSPGLDDLYTEASGVPIQGAAGAYLTGDGNAVLLDASLTWHITDPAAYALARDHVDPALDRLFRAAAVGVAGGQKLDDFLVASPSRSAGTDGQAVAAIRQQMRDSLLAAVNARLDALAATAAPLGVAIDRIDLTAWLPPQAMLAYDALLVAEQVADRGIANAHTTALRTTQQAQRDVRQIIDAAHAALVERVSAANTESAPVLALEGEHSARAGLMLDAYRARITAIFHTAGQVVAVDPSGGNRLLLPGSGP